MIRENDVIPQMHEMWNFIDDVICRNEILPDKTILDEVQVFSMYSALIEIDKMLRNAAQIELLKQAIDAEIIN